MPMIVLPPDASEARRLERRTIVITPGSGMPPPVPGLVKKTHVPLARVAPAQPVKDEHCFEQVVMICPPPVPVMLVAEGKKVLH